MAPLGPGRIVKFRRLGLTRHHAGRDLTHRAGVVLLAMRAMSTSQAVTVSKVDGGGHIGEEPADDRTFRLRSGLRLGGWHFGLKLPLGFAGQS